VSDNRRTSAFGRLPLRRKVLVVLAAPLWLPVAFVAWLEGGNRER
jgi:hypothetical protein